MFPGDVIDERFEVERFVARGGMGDVYRARDRATGKIVALKFLIDRQEALLHRLDREARGSLPSITRASSRTSRTARRAARRTWRWSGSTAFRSPSTSRAVDSRSTRPSRSASASGARAIFAPPRDPKR
jgi:hypothetical protein